MKNLILFLLVFFTCSLSAQQSGTNVIISKATADWCPNCGSWGWSFFEAVQEEFDNSGNILLGVHHSGGLENPVSNWFANNLGNTYQPQFFLNNERFNVISSNWQQRVEEMKDAVEVINNTPPPVDIVFVESYMDADKTIHTRVNVTPDNMPAGDYFFGVYLFENDVEWYQSNQGSNAMHPFVLRDIMADEFFGDPFTPGLSPSGNAIIEKSYTVEDDSWNTDKVGLLAILWIKEGNKYLVQNTAAQYNVGLLSSDNDIDLQLQWSAYAGPESIEIEVTEGGKYNATIYNTSGREIKRTVMEQRVSIPTDGIPGGIYIVTLQGEKGISSKQIIINN